MQNSKNGQLSFRHEINLSNEHSLKTPTEIEYTKNVPYASVVGSFIYAMLHARSNICYAVAIFSRYQSNLGLEHWVSMKHILKYLRGMREYMIV